MKNIKQFIMAGIALLMLTACPEDPVVEPKTYTQDVTLPSNGSKKNVTLNQLQASIAAVENSSSWLTVEAQPYTSGSPQVKLRSTDNTAKKERKCSVTITATSGDKVVLSVTQQGGYEGTEIDDLHGSQTDKPAYRRQK